MENEKLDVIDDVISDKEINQDGVAGGPVKGFKTFRNSADIENFYRFINDNHLRREAKLLFEKVVPLLTQTKKKRNKKATAH